MSGDESDRDDAGSPPAADGDRDEPGSFPRTPREARFSRALERGLAIIACFTPERPVLGIREIAELLEMSPATAYRSARALVGQGYLEQDAQSKYRLALGAIDLGLASLNATGLCKHARPYMEELGKRSGYEVILGVLDGGEVLVVDQVPSTRRDQSVVDWQGQASGKRLPAHSTSLGKALLAGLAGEQGIGDVAMENEEWRLGTCTIAAPVRDESGDVVAAVSVVAHNGAIELEDLTNRWSGWLLMTAERISKRLGYLG